ncbi:MAG: PTS sugar transporter subunit IIA [Desulfobacteraceae bacterium]|nr:PTS sugar transporter subunit IIA [Desulfobacteraceae bacterium]
MLADLVHNRIESELKAASKREALQELAGAACAGTPGLKRDQVYQALQEREGLGSTGIGEGIAIPHGKLKELDRIIICFGRSRAGVPFDAVDGKPVHLFFVLLAPESAAREYLHTLAQLSRFLKNPSVRARLLQAGTVQELSAIFREAAWD